MAYDACFIQSFPPFLYLLVRGPLFSFNAERSFPFIMLSAHIVTPLDPSRYGTFWRFAEVYVLQQLSIGFFAFSSPWPSLSSDLLPLALNPNRELLFVKMFPRPVSIPLSIKDVTLRVLRSP